MIVNEWTDRRNSIQNEKSNARGQHARLLILGELVENRESLVDLPVHRIGRLQQVKKLVVVHLEQHSGDFTSQLGLSAKRKERSDEFRKEQMVSLPSDLHVNDFTEHLLLLHRRSIGELSRCERRQVAVRRRSSSRRPGTTALRVEFVRCRLGRRRDTSTSHTSISDRNAALRRRNALRDRTGATVDLGRAVDARHGCVRVSR